MSDLSLETVIEEVETAIGQAGPVKSFDVAASYIHWLADGVVKRGVHEDPYLTRQQLLLIASIAIRCILNVNNPIIDQQAAKEFETA